MKQLLLIVATALSISSVALAGIDGKGNDGNGSPPKGVSKNDSAGPKHEEPTGGGASGQNPEPTRDIVPFADRRPDASGFMFFVSGHSHFSWF